jgi:DNA-binding NarL/FixJ family response regulator
MKILLWSDDLMSRVRIESAWRQAGAHVLKKHDADRPDCIVMDLTARDALAQIERLRGSYPDVDILAFGPHVDGEGFKAARAAGATEVVARSAVVERGLRRLQSPSN